MVILPYKIGSNSAKKLAEYFSCKRIYPDGNFKPKEDEIILNWGYSGDVNFRRNKNTRFFFFNDPQHVKNAINKINTLTILKENDVPTLEFTTSFEEAKNLVLEGEVYCRTKISGKGGDGIVIAKNQEELEHCQLYTKKFINNREFRVHIVDGHIIDIVRKRKMSKESLLEANIDPETVNSSIRNLTRGWVFSREGLERYEEVDLAALNAIKALNLDFGACDILFNTNTNKVAVIEVNTAPGMDEGSTTHMRYIKAFSELFNKPFSIESYNERYNCDLKFGVL